MPTGSHSTPTLRSRVWRIGPARGRALYTVCGPDHRPGSWVRQAAPRKHSGRWRAGVESDLAARAALDLAPRAPGYDSVLAKRDPEQIPVEAEFAQRRQRVGGGLARTRVPRWNRAARAGLHQMQRDLPHGEGIDAVFGPGGQAAHDDIRSKALDGYSLRQARIQILERGLVADQERVAVRKPQRCRGGSRELTVRRTLHIRCHPHQTHGLTDHPAHPFVSRPALIHSYAGVLPHPHRHLLTTAVQRHAQRRHVRGVKHQCIGGDLGHDARELRMSALAQELAFGIDEHPLAVPFEPPRSHAHARLRDAARRFHRIDEQLAHPDPRLQPVPPTKAVTRGIERAPPQSLPYALGPAGEEDAWEAEKSPGRSAPGWPDWRARR